MIWCRVYAVTGRKKLLCSPLALLVITQAVWAILTVFIFPHAGGSFDSRSFTLVDGYPAQQLPEEILDLFRLCILQPWDVGAFAYFGTALAFGVFLSSNFYFWNFKMSHVLHPTLWCYRHPRLLDYRLQRLDTAAG